MGSPEVAVDDRHYPKLYSRFLKGLLDTPMAKYDPPKQPVQSNAKAQSESPTIRYGELRESSASSTRGSVSNPSSARPSASPPPNQHQHPHQHQPVDDFSQQLAAGLDPYSSALFQGHNTLNVPEYFNPPLPFEPEMIQSMQSLTDPSVYPDVMSGKWASSMPFVVYSTYFHTQDSHGWVTCTKTIMIYTCNMTLEPMPSNRV